MATANSAATVTRRRLPPGTAGGDSRLSRGCTSSTSDAPAISTGTTTVNVPAGVSSRIAAPAAPPSAVMRPRRSTRRPCPASSGRDPATEPAPVKARATVLVMLADSGGTPSASSVG